LKILLISMNRLAVPYPVFPLGLDHVAGAVQARHEPRILDLCDCPPGAEGSAIGDAVRAFGPGAVGISIRNIDNTDVAELHGFLAEMRAVVDAVRSATKAPIILGGAGYTLFPSDLLEALGADYGIIGEGERLPELLAALEQGRSPCGMPFVAVRGERAADPLPWNGRPVRCEPTLNPSLSHYLSQGGMLNLQTKRGCPYHCVYCTYPAIEGRTFRLFDPADLARQARKLQEAGARYIFITDSVFNGHTEHSLAVARAFHAEGLTIPWGGYFVPRKPPAGYYDELASLGLTHAEFGTDVLCESMIERVGKTFHVADAIEAQRAAVAAGINTAHFMLLGGPGETAQTVDETLDNCERLEKTALFFFCGMRIYPRTPLYEVALAEGQIPQGKSLLEPIFYKPPAISFDEIRARVSARAAGRTSWVVGSGGEKSARLVARLHQRGHVGPLWEMMID
jgi:radical SAM superfamily enzyme YgiQ (UPF0313 family)